MRELVSRAKSNVDEMMSQLKMMPAHQGDVKTRIDMTKWFEATSSDLRNLDELVTSSTYWAASNGQNRQLNGHFEPSNRLNTILSTDSNDFTKLNNDNVRF